MHNVSGLVLIRPQRALEWLTLLSVTGRLNLTFHRLFRHQELTSKSVCLVFKVCEIPTRALMAKLSGPIRAPRLVSVCRQISDCLPSILVFADRYPTTAKMPRKFQAC